MIFSCFFFKFEFSIFMIFFKFFLILRPNARKRSLACYLRVPTHLHKESGFSRTYKKKVKVTFGEK